MSEQLSHTQLLFCTTKSKGSNWSLEKLAVTVFWHCAAVIFAFAVRSSQCSLDSFRNLYWNLIFARLAINIFLLKTFDTKYGVIEVDEIAEITDLRNDYFSRLELFPVSWSYKKQFSRTNINMVNTFRRQNPISVYIRFWRLKIQILTHWKSKSFILTVETYYGYSNVAERHLWWLQIEKKSLDSMVYIKIFRPCEG